MLNRQQTSKRFRFGGLVWFWAITRQPNESSRQRFIRTYESLRDAVEHRTLDARARTPWWKWQIIRIQESGRWFLGIARH